VKAVNYSLHHINTSHAASIWSSQSYDKMANHSSTKLFEPFRIGTIELSHRIVMASMTRFRTNKDQVILPFVKDYYAQRASTPGTLLFSEAAVVSRLAGSITHMPEIWSDTQITAWKPVVDAVHAKGSYMFAQLVGNGRCAFAEERAKDGLDLIGPSAIAVGSSEGAGVVPNDGKNPIPREMTEVEIWQVINDFAQAAKNAVEICGFDGVEIHACNGHLVDQFIQDTSNQRTDAWGGSKEKRSRFAIEIAKAVIAAVGKDKVGFRFSPFSAYLSMRMADPLPQFIHLTKELKALEVAFIHLIEPRIAGDTFGSGVVNSDSTIPYMDAWGNERPIIVAGGYTAESAQKALAAGGMYEGRNVAIAFGRHYVSNPDLVFRVKNGVTLTPYDRATFYSVGSEKGYTDYEFSKDFTTEVCSQA
jgi:NADPH2 dehydrogenase